MGKKPEAIEEQGVGGHLCVPGSKFVIFKKQANDVIAENNKTHGRGDGDVEDRPDCQSQTILEILPPFPCGKPGEGGEEDCGDCHGKNSQRKEDQPLPETERCYTPFRQPRGHINRNPIV